MSDITNKVLFAYGDYMVVHVTYNASEEEVAINGPPNPRLAILLNGEVEDLRARRVALDPCGFGGVQLMGSGIVVLDINLFYQDYIVHNGSISSYLGPFLYSRLLKGDLKNTLPHSHVKSFVDFIESLRNTDPQ